MTAGCLRSSARVARARNQYDEAERLARRSLSIIEKRWGGRPDLRRYSCRSWGKTRLARGDLKEAESLSASGTTGRKVVGSATPGLRFATANLLGGLSSKQGEYAKASALAAESPASRKDLWTLITPILRKAWDTLAQIDQGLETS